MKAVNRPGSLNSSAAFRATSQAERNAGDPGTEAIAFGNLFFEKAVDDLDRDLDRLVAALLDHLVPALAGRVGEERRIAGEELREEAHVVRVVGHHQEIERLRELHPHAVRRRHLLAAREAVGVRGKETRAEGAGVHRHRRCAGACRPRRRGSGSCGRRTASSSSAPGRRPRALRRWAPALERSTPPPRA